MSDRLEGSRHAMGVGDREFLSSHFDRDARIGKCMPIGFAASEGYESGFMVRHSHSPYASRSSRAEVHGFIGTGRLASLQVTTRAPASDRLLAAQRRIRRNPRDTLQRATVTLRGMTFE